MQAREYFTALRTYVGGFGFGVPAVAGVVGHLVVHVLTETYFVFRQTNFGQVEVDPPDEIAQDRVVDDTLKTSGSINQTKKFSRHQTLMDL